MLSLGTIGLLVALALIDSTSFGTLLIPVWLLLVPGRIQPGKLLLFLATVAGFYFVVGLLLTSGATLFLDLFNEAIHSTPFLVAEVAVGAVLAILGITMEPWTRAGKAKRAEARAVRETQQGPGRMARMRARATDGTAPVGAVVGLALTAAAIEVASMLPYLAAIGTLVAADLPWAGSALVLAAYCLVMVLPALALLGLRLAMHERLSPLLGSIEAWMRKNSREMIAWVVFVIGVYVGVGGAQELGWIK
ncbi:MAG: GAP family protein [Nocardioides sp.]|nr:GAP family protein [Nocardioides sp.]